MTELIQAMPDIAAIKPYYNSDGGNFTLVYTSKGAKFEHRRRLKTVLKNIVSFYGFEPAALRKKYSELLGTKQNVPLPLTASLVLVPLKMRKPHFDQDGATGYVNVCAVKAVKEESPPLKNGKGSEETLCGCLVCLNGGSSLRSLFSAQNTNKRLQLGRQALMHHLALQGAPQFKLKERGLFAQTPSSALSSEEAANRLLLELLLRYQGHTKAADSFNRWEE